MTQLQLLIVAYSPFYRRSDRPTNLSCHICVGGDGTPCTDDPKSSQHLKCERQAAYRYSLSLLKAIKYPQPVRNILSCLSLGYRKVDRNLRYLRSCMKAPNNTCLMLEGVLLETTYEFVDCIQCTTDFCNGVGRSIPPLLVLPVTIITAASIKRVNFFF